jgi:hypothetical protein
MGAIHHIYYLGMVSNKSYEVFLTRGTLSLSHRARRGLTYDSLL